ncbi:hypothetical protein [Stenotrophomonas sp. MMGLT7]|nr:hypothetical protein [Stenotrophomonas sp. MMGLT7]MCD7096823.1 hypothetical protein [Stenotrophomonas sp. MMGLT7]
MKSASYEVSVASPFKAQALGFRLASHGAVESRGVDEYTDAGARIDVSS